MLQILRKKGTVSSQPGPYITQNVTNKVPCLCHCRPWHIYITVCFILLQEPWCSYPENMGISLGDCICNFQSFLNFRTHDLIPVFRQYTHASFIINFRPFQSLYHKWVWFRTAWSFMKCHLKTACAICMVSSSFLQCVLSRYHDTSWNFMAL